MKKNKLSVVALVISLLPFITLLISLFSVKITGGLQMGLTALNVISILLGLGLSISVEECKLTSFFPDIAMSPIPIPGVLRV